MTAIDLATGALRWRASFDGNVRAPAVAGGIVYLSVDGERRIVASTGDGRRLWDFDLDGANECCIAVTRGLAFVGTAAGRVYAIGGDGAKVVPKPAPNAAQLPTSPPGKSALPPLDTGVIWAVESGAPDFPPWRLAQAPDGRLWATEGSATASRSSRRWRIRRVVGDVGGPRWRVRPDSRQRRSIGSVAFAPTGSLYVLDAGNHRVQLFDPIDRSSGPGLLRNDIRASQ